MRSALRRFGPALVTVSLVAGVVVDKGLFHTPPAGAVDYHATVRRAAEQLPDRIGTWVASDIPVPPAAIEILHPNVILSRRFHDMQTGRLAHFLLVQCTDARDLLGHYPPGCYPGQGWTQISAAPRDWQIDGLSIAAMRYEFAMPTLQREDSLVVDNVMLLADGAMLRDMRSLRAAARKHERRFFGAAQLQVLTDQSFSPQERDELFILLVRTHRSLIDAIREGTNHE